MKIRQRAIRATALSTTVVATAFGLATVGPAQAAPPAGAPAAAHVAARQAAPAFLAPEELPPHRSSEWFAGEVTDGLPGIPVLCRSNDVLPAEGAAHRKFHTDLDTEAVQVTVVAADAKSARKLAAEAEKSLRDCAAQLNEEYPDASAEGADFGPVDVQEGAHVYGVGTAFPESSYNVNLYGVGRDGRTVTVVRWGQMGTLEDAPVAEFKEATRTAVEKLYS